MEVKRFSTRKEAERWAATFTYGRAICRLAPLAIVADGSEWVVDNPDRGAPFVAPTPEPTRRVVRVSAAEIKRIDKEPANG